MNNNTFENIGTLPLISTHATDSIRFICSSKSAFDRLYIFYAFPTIGKTHAITEMRKQRVQAYDERDRKIILLDTDDLHVQVQRTIGHSRDHAIAIALLTYLNEHPDQYVVLVTNLWTLVRLILSHSDNAHLVFAAKYQPLPWLVDVVMDQAVRRGENMDRTVLLTWLNDDKLIEWFAQLRRKYELTASLYNIAEETDLPVVRRVLTSRLKRLVLDTLRRKVAV